jgi:hypothetical protein
MMIIGHKSVAIRDGKIRNIVCPHCAENTAMQYTAFSKYVHFYWIPVVPVQKIKILECEHFNAIFELKNMSEIIQKKVQKFEDFCPLKFPIHHFTGLFLILILFVYFYYTKQL